MSLFNDIEMKMKHNNLSHKVVAENISLANVPGAEAMEVKPFELKNGVVKKNNIKMTVTSAAHLTGANEVSEFKVQKSKDSFENTINGNNIDLTEQTMNMTKIKGEQERDITIYKEYSKMYKNAISSK